MPRQPTKFKHLIEGSLFMWGERLYVKLFEVEDILFNAVCLSTRKRGRLSYISPEFEVLPLTGDIQIYDTVRTIF
jgi:hypothetical protein